MTTPTKHLEIIGHPIHLENILRAIALKYKKEVFITSKGEIREWSSSWGGDYISLTNFDLDKPFHLQSDEFISWLYGVLVNE